MTDIKELLDRALPAASGVSVSRETAIMAGRRALRRRRARLAGTGAGLATLAITLGVAFGRVIRPWRRRSPGSPLPPSPRQHPR
jgi:hypothetical protein